MCVVATNAVALCVCFGCGSGGAGMLVAKGDVVVYEVADGLHPRPAERRMSEEVPSLIGKAIGFAVAAAKQERQGFRRQGLYLVLQPVQANRTGHPPTTKNGASAEGEKARKRDDTAA